MRVSNQRGLTKRPGRNDSAGAEIQARASTTVNGPWPLGRDVPEGPTRQVLSRPLRVWECSSTEAPNAATLRAPQPLPSLGPLAASYLRHARENPTLAGDARGVFLPPRLSPAPTGTVVFVFTDVQSSTQLWEQCGEAMPVALDVHNRVLRARLAATSGYEVKTQGDSFMVAFASVTEAVRWCLEAQEALLQAPWPTALLAHPQASEERGPQGRALHRGLRVRMGVHLGEAECRIDERTGRADYFGRAVNVAARVSDAGHGGQVLLSGAAWAQLAHRLEEVGQPAVRALGEFRFKGIEEPCALIEVLPASLADRGFGASGRRRSGEATCPPSWARWWAASRSWRCCASASTTARGWSPSWGPAAWARRAWPRTSAAPSSTRSSAGTEASGCAC